MANSDVDPSEGPLLARRAERAAAMPDEAKHEVTVPIAELDIAGNAYALPMASLLGASPLGRITPVPLAPPHVVGVVQHEGRVLTVASLASLLQIQGWRADPSVLLVVEGQAGRRFVLDAEDVPRPSTLVLSRVKAASRAGEAFFSEVPAEDDRVVRLVDVEAIAAILAGEGA